MPARKPFRANAKERFASLLLERQNTSELLIGFLTSNGALSYAAFC
jgi:hypothetical protein